MDCAAFASGEVPADSGNTWGGNVVTIQDVCARSWLSSEIHEAVPSSQEQVNLEVEVPRP